MVYRQQRRRAQTAPLLEALRRQVESLARTTHADRDDLIFTLIEAGEFTSAVLDTHFPARDGVDDVSESCLEIVARLAAAADAAWRGRHRDSAVERYGALKAVDRCQSLELPREVSLSVSEGFAYYAVGPELYAEAARGWVRHQRPDAAWCVGLRTIGVTLAATVAGALEAEHVRTRLLSLRPHGHPFDRQPVLDDILRQAIAASSNDWWLVIDEGPGISGSSIAGAARVLRRAGVPTSRIVLMPGYAPDINRLSEGARAEWSRHEIVAADFERTWLDSGRLAAAAGTTALIDVGAGKWRDRATVPGGRPAIHPSHERRKFIVEPAGQPALLKFAGYGRYGRELAHRAAVAADEGFAPAVIGLAEGWLRYEYVASDFGVDAIGGADITRAAEYLSFIRRTRTTSAEPNLDGLREMAITNARAVAGDTAALVLGSLPIHDPPAVVLTDGHMRSHEWVRRQQGLQKSDGVEHGDDHFFPGPCDIAWDLAGVIEEWQLDSTGAAMLIEHYEASSGDDRVARRLPFYRAAYVAFRAAYTALARDQLRGTPDAAGLARDHRRYRERLEALSSCVC